MNATEQAVLAAAQAAVQAANQRVDALLEAQQMLDRQLPEAQAVLRAAHVTLRRAKGDTRPASRQQELEILKQRIAEVQTEENHHAHRAH